MSQWIVKMSCGSNLDMETSASLVNAIIDNALAVPLRLTHQSDMLSEIVQILHFCLVDMLPQIL